MSAAAPLPFTPSFPARTTLTAKDRIVLRAVAEAMFAEDGEADRDRLDAHVHDVDAFISSASKPLRAGLRIALFVVRIAPILFFFRMRTIERLSLAERVAILSRLERSKLAELSLAFIGWRTVMVFVFYEQAAELKSLGYASHERHVYKRHLALVTPVHVPVRVPVLLPDLVAAVAPPPEESGVRLRGDADAHADDDSDSEQVA
ncbi:MAG: Enoyl-CoA hydratase [Labilithrix sp.]|nr:Enoyl-CoA hydratase [Labilithrix sp.]